MYTNAGTTGRHNRMDPAARTIKPDPDGPLMDQAARPHVGLAPSTGPAANRQRAPLVQQGTPWAEGPPEAARAKRPHSSSTQDDETQGPPAKKQTVATDPAVPRNMGRDGNRRAPRKRRRKVEPAAQTSSSAAPAPAPIPAPVNPFALVRAPPSGPLSQPSSFLQNPFASNATKSSPSEPLQAPSTAMPLPPAAGSQQLQPEHIHHHHYYYHFYRGVQITMADARGGGTNGRGGVVQVGSGGLGDGGVREVTDVTMDEGGVVDGVDTRLSK